MLSSKWVTVIECKRLVLGASWQAKNIIWLCCSHLPFKNRHPDLIVLVSMVAWTGDVDNKPGVFMPGDQSHSCRWQLFRSARKLFQRGFCPNVYQSSSKRQRNSHAQTRSFQKPCCHCQAEQVPLCLTDGSQQGPGWESHLALNVSVT
jgi:hypothetical protein